MIMDLIKLHLSLWQPSKVHFIIQLEQDAQVHSTEISVLV